VAGKYKASTGSAVCSDCPSNCVLSLNSSSTCARFFALVAGGPSFASVASRGSSPVGSNPCQSTMRMAGRRARATSPSTARSRSSSTLARAP
jgi:hypothetical protein